MTPGTVTAVTDLLEGTYDGAWTQRDRDVARVAAAAERERCAQMAEQEAAAADLAVHSDESVLASQVFRRFAAAAAG